LSHVKRFSLGNFIVLGKESHAIVEGIDPQQALVRKQGLVRNLARNIVAQMRPPFSFSYDLLILLLIPGSIIAFFFELRLMNLLMVCSLLC